MKRGVGEGVTRHSRARPTLLVEPEPICWRASYLREEGGAEGERRAGRERGVEGGTQREVRIRGHSASLNYHHHHLTYSLIISDGKFLCPQSSSTPILYELFHGRARRPPPVFAWRV